MPTTIYHVQFKHGRHDYFTSLSAVFTEFSKEDLGISKYTLDRWDWSLVYENDLVTIRKGTARSKSDIQKQNDQFL